MFMDITIGKDAFHGMKKISTAYLKHNEKLSTFPCFKDSSIRVLDIYGAALKGIPEVCSNLTFLERLYIRRSNMSFSHDVNHISKMTSLNTLHIEGSQLTNISDETLMNINKLEYLKIVVSKLSSPPEITHCQNICYLDL